MERMNSPSLDLASFFAAVLAVFVAEPIAHAMGVYAAIIIAAVFGAGLALVRADAMSRWASVRFLVLMTGIATIATVGVAEFINHWIRLNSINPLLAPVSLVIAAVGHDWPRAVRGAWASARKVFEGRYGAPHRDRFDDHHPPRRPPTSRFTKEAERD